MKEYYVNSNEFNNFSSIHASKSIIEHVTKAGIGKQVKQL